MAINIDYTSFDYDALKAELIQYLRETGTFKDVDVEASNINTITGLYSYIGSLFGYYTNSIANEVFLPSAKRYKNLNRIAQLVAYNPRGDQASGLNVIGSLNPEYCLGKEDTYFEIPSYSLFPSTKRTPNGQEFVFTNPKIYPYAVRSFGVDHVEQSDFTYAGLSLPITKNSSFWGSTTTVEIDATQLELAATDTNPLSILNRLDTNNYKGYDTESAPLFDPQDSSSVGQPFTRNIKTTAPSFQLVPGEIYYVIWNYNSDIGSPYLSILEEGEKLDEKNNDIITAIRLENEGSGNYTLREVQNNAKGRFYRGVLGQQNLNSVEFEFDIIEGTENSIKQVHMDINKSGDKSPYRVLVDGNVYVFPSGRISSQVFGRNNWDVNVTSYNVNLVIESPEKSELNYNATLNITTDEPGVNEITVSKIYPSYVDSETNTSTVIKESGERFGDFQVVPDVELNTSAQKQGYVEVAEGINKVYVQFSEQFNPTDISSSSDYVISLTPEENVQVWYTDKTADGFVVNIEPDVGFVGKVYWLATQFSESEIRQIEVVYDETYPRIDGESVDYTVFLSTSDNVVSWVSDKSELGFKINVERSYQGTVTWSTFAFFDDDKVEEESNSSTLNRGTATLTSENRSQEIRFFNEFSDDSYGLHMIANKNVSVWYTNKTANGFTVNVEEGFEGQVNIDWFADFSTEYQFQKHGIVSFLGQLSSRGTLPGLRFDNVPETFKVNDLKQGNILFSFVNQNNAIDSANNSLDMRFSADRKSFDDMKFFINANNISYSDLRVFVKNSGGDWEEWSEASNMITSTSIDVGEKVFFVRVNEYKKVEISFGDGETFGVNPKGREMYIFGLETVGADGNIPPNSLSDSVVLSKEILGDDNVTLQFEQQFIQLVGLKKDVFFASDERTNATTLYDSEGTKLTTSELTIKQNTSAFGGNFPETTEELRVNASTANLRQNRIVSLGDYKGYIDQAFSNYITKVQVLSYDELKESGLISENDLEKYWFNTVFIVALPKTGNIITKDQRDLIINSLNDNANAMLTVDHELLSATLVPIDVRIKYKKKLNATGESVEAIMNTIVTNYFDRENRSMGEELHHSDLVSMLSDVQGIDYVEMSWNKDAGDKLSVSDYDIDAHTDVNETVQEVKRRKVLELLAKDPNLLTIVEPLFDVTDTATDTRTWLFSNNITMSKYEFPILGDTIIEQAE